MSVDAKDVARKEIAHGTGKAVGTVLQTELPFVVGGPHVVWQLSRYPGQPGCFRFRPRRVGFTNPAFESIRAAVETAGNVQSGCTRLTRSRS